MDTKLNLESLEEDSGQPNSSWTVSELRDFLQRRGGRLSGRKSDLVERYASSVAGYDDTRTRRPRAREHWLLTTSMDLISFFFCRALFYSRNKDAAKTKASTKKERISVTQAVSVSTRPTFPISGWSSDPSKLPLVTASTVVGHLMRTGKQVSTSGEDVALVQKSLRRGQDFFMVAMSTMCRLPQTLR